MANIITAGNSTNGGTAITTDTSGTLNIVTGSGSGATAIAVDTSQSTTFNSAASTAPFIAKINGTESARIDSSGNLCVGITSSTSKLYVYDANDRTQSTAQVLIGGNGYNAYHWMDTAAYYIGQNSQSRDLRIYSGNNSAVGVKLTPNATSWATYSDERLKDIIEPIKNALSKVLTLRAVIGKYKVDDADKRRVMMIAQDVKAVLPEATSEDDNGMLSMAYDNIVPLLTAAIKEQQVMILELKAELDAVKAKVGA